MAKKKSMTMEEAIQAILASEGDNPLRMMMLEFMVQNVLEWEMTEHLGSHSAHLRTDISELSSQFS